MSAPAILARPDIALRWMIQRDLPHVLRIEDQVRTPRWSDEDFREAFQSIDVVARVAEVGDRIVGFVVYRITQDPDVIDPESIQSFLQLRPNSAAQAVTAGPAQIEILNLAVAPGFRREGIGRGLLQVVERRLQQSGGCIRFVVPETCLACQLLLRGAGFRATRVLRGHFGDEAGFQMER